MKLHEVLESRKKFRRKSWKNEGFYFVVDCNTIYDSIGRFRTYCIEDMLADDWEIFEQKIELSESQIREAIEKHIICTKLISDIKEDIIQELGFDNE